MNHRLRGAIGSLALAALLGASLTGIPARSIAAQDTPAATETPQTEADAAAAALSTGKYPFGTELMLLNGQASVKNAAGSEAATLTEIDEGTTVTVLAGPEPIGGVDWYQVETEGGITGWIAADQFGIAKGGAVLAPGTEREIVADTLNLRAEAGTGAEVISGLVQGDTVTIVGGAQVVDELDWYQVDTAYGEQGWLAGVYLEQTAGGATTAPATDAAAGATTQPAAAGAQTTETPEAGTATDAASAASTFPAGSYVFIAGDGESVNLRADASIESDVVSQLADSAIGLVNDAPVLGGDYSWYPVTFGTGDAAVTGYVAGDFLTGGITVGAAAEVTDGPLNVRATASTEGEPLGQLEAGASVTVVSGPTETEDLVWFEISSDDLTGFVAGQYLGAPAA
ncbi:MAG: hypothetical protein E6R14_11890 [Thermomicrobiales bacterium]|nr:MAG: hypothetical protein E6R14_11890 [Thermomicrobiales bacterium]